MRFQFDLPSRARAIKKPIMNRCFWVLSVLALMPEIVHAEPADEWTEARVVARALERPALQDVLRGEVEAAEGRRRAASAYANPQVSYMREQTLGTRGSREDYLSLAQVIDLGNRRGLAGEAGAARVEAARHDGRSAQLAVASAARIRFFDLLYRQERVASFEGWLTRIDEALKIVTRREQSGDVATYDRRRLERERFGAAAKGAAEQAALERANARLAAILDRVGNSLSVSGTILPNADPPSLEALRTSAASRPELRVLEATLAAAARDRSAATRWWLPDLRLEAGWKGVAARSAGRTDGFLIGGSLALPLWDRSAGRSRAATGEAQAARGRRALLESELFGELTGARDEAVQLRAAATTFRDQSAKASEDLVRIVSAGYEGGEQGLLELLDAYRGAAEDALTALDMAYAARKARIELDRMTGTGSP